MPAPRVTVKTKIFELEIVLEQVQPSVRRRVQVPGEASLAVLHEVVQSVMGWSNSHLHEFNIAGRRFGMPDPGGGDQDLTDEAKGKLFRLVKQGDRFGYLYDFGDNWAHRITVEKVAAAEPGVRYPRCMTGQGACPPEDVGGPWGYDEFQAALADPKHYLSDQALVDLRNRQACASSRSPYGNGPVSVGSACWAWAAPSKQIPPATCRPSPTTSRWSTGSGPASAGSRSGRTTI
jgi:hypothetical protein